MKTVNIHEAKTHLSKLVEQVELGESFIVAKSGTPVARLVPIDAIKQPRRLGFMAGEFTVPADFDRMADREIAKLFGTEP